MNSLKRLFFRVAIISATFVALGVSTCAGNPFLPIVITESSDEKNSNALVESVNESMKALDKRIAQTAIEIVKNNLDAQLKANNAADEATQFDIKAVKTFLQEEKKNLNGDSVLVNLYKDFMCVSMWDSDSSERLAKVEFVLSKSLTSAASRLQKNPKYANAASDEEKAKLLVKTVRESILEDYRRFSKNDSNADALKSRSEKPSKWALWVLSVVKKDGFKVSDFRSGGIVASSEKMATVYKTYMIAETAGEAVLGLVDNLVGFAESNSIAIDPSDEDFSDWSQEILDEALAEIPKLIKW